MKQPEKVVVVEQTVRTVVSNKWIFLTNVLSTTAKPSERNSVNDNRK